jgi:hypothetical protein
MDNFAGQWELVGAASAATSIGFVPPSFEVEFAQLSREALELVPKIEPTSGLSLKIMNSDRFMQVVSGHPNVTWYDVEGMLENQVIPFDGSCTMTDNRLYLIADQRPNWAISKDKTRQKFFRYDDGDTVVCDFVELIQGQLHRTVNVLTYSLYKSQILMVFERR